MDNVLEVAENLTDLADNVEIDDDNLEDISSILTDIVSINDPSPDVSENSYISSMCVFPIGYSHDRVLLP